jgi:hypothetical protein
MKFTIHKARFLALAVIVALFAGAVAVACPFCDAPAQTLSEETAAADAVVLARLIKPAAPADDAADPNSGTATFEIVEVLRGKDRLKDTKHLEAVYFGEFDKEQMFMISGLGADQLDWTTPLPLSKAAEDYVRKLPSVPPSGAERLVFFQDYLENEDPLLAQDAYDEFARAPYEEVIALGPRMHHDKLVNWISDFEINPSRRRLYLTMLGVCGSEADLPLLESMITSDFTKMEPALQGIVATGIAMRGPLCLPGYIEIVQQQERQKKLGLDALVACYLTLRGADGLDLIDKRFLTDPKVDYTHVYSTIMALRFHGDQDTGVLPKERLLSSIRLLLNNPDFSDQVILDLSRWEDWSVLDRLVEMFKQADEKSYVRQPVVTYLTVAAEQKGDVGQRATKALAELESLDPDTVKQARSLMAFGALARAKGGSDATTGEATEDKTDASPDTQAFAASKSDNETDASDLPDPVEYEEGQGDQSPANTSPAERVAQASTTATGAAKTMPVAANMPTGAEIESAPNPLLIIGVPLLAAGLLMGVYWLILRLGAV